MSDTEIIAVAIAFGISMLVGVVFAVARARRDRAWNPILFIGALAVLLAGSLLLTILLLRNTGIALPVVALVAGALLTWWYFHTLPSRAWSGSESSRRRLVVMSGLLTVGQFCVAMVLVVLAVTQSP